MHDTLCHDYDLTMGFAKVVCERTWRWYSSDNPINDYDLWYIWDGEGQLELNGTPYDIGKGSCFLFRPGDLTKASHQPENPLIVTFIHFSLKSVPNEIPIPYRMLEERIYFESLLNRYVVLMTERPFAYRQEASSILKLMMISLLRIQHEPSDKRKSKAGKQEVQAERVVKELAAYIRENPELPHTIKDLAAKAYMSERYFSLKFKEHLNLSVQYYIIYSRLDRAEYLLMYSGMNVSEVAEALGYKDIYFFSRQFKRLKGKNPSKSRNERKL